MGQIEQKKKANSGGRNLPSTLNNLKNGCKIVISYMNGIMICFHSFSTKSYLPTLWLHVRIYNFSEKNSFVQFTHYVWSSY